MGYSTDFTGSVTVEPPLTAAEVAFLREFAPERHDDYEIPGIPRTPWCQWEPTDDGTAIKWNDTEKFYDGEQWMRYLVNTFIAPAGHVVNGVIEAQGDDSDDRWDLIVTDNVVTVRKYAMVSAEATIVPQPNRGGTDWDWTDVEGNELTISGDGSVMVDAVDDWVDLNADQWAEVAAVALLMSERLGTTKAEG